MDTWEENKVGWMIKKKEILFEALDVCSLLCRLLVQYYLFSFVFAGMIFLCGKEICASVWGLGEVEVVMGIIKPFGLVGGFVMWMSWFLSGRLESDIKLWKWLFLGISLLLFMYFPLSNIMFVGIEVFRFICFLVRKVCEDLEKMRERRGKL